MGWRCDNRDNAGISDISCDSGRHRWNSINVWKKLKHFYDLKEKWTLSVWMDRKISMTVIFTHHCAHCLSCLLRIKLSSSSWLSSVAALLPRRSVVTIPYYCDFFILGSPDTWVCIYVRYCTVFVPRLRLIDSTNHYTFIEIMWLPYHQSI